MMMIYTTTKFKRRRGQSKVAPKPRKKKQPFVELKPREYMDRAESTASYPSRMISYMMENNPVLEKPIRYEGEMAEREALAQKEIERKKTMVAPICNKGGYQYVGDVPPEVVQTLGRKV